MDAQTLTAEYDALRAKCQARTATEREVRRALTLAARLRAAGPAPVAAAGAGPASKLSTLIAALRSGRVREAVAIAARFPDLGAERAAILDAHAAFTNESFCRQLGKDPAALIEAGRAALLRRYRIDAAAAGI